MKRAFLEKLLPRLHSIRPEEIETYFVELARDNRLFETIFNTIREGVIVTDRRGTVTYVNNAACSLFGLDPSAALGRPLADHISGLRWKDLAHGNDVVSRDIEVFHPEHRILNFYVVPLLEDPSSQDSPDPLHAGYALILRDFTERHRETRETLESERIAALQLLAAGVAHEIGNPLNSLTIHLQLLERRLCQLPEDLQNKFLDPLAIARNEIKRLDSIVTQFLRAIRPAPLNRAPHDLNSILRDTAAFLSPELDARNIILDLDLSPVLPLLDVDQDQLKQAFYNIIKNASEAMNQGGHIKIRTQSDNDWVTTTFTDTGGGISAETMAHIFDPYFTTKSGGNGLGLMITQRIIRSHGGDIALESSPGIGLTTSIRLPRRERQAKMLPPLPLSLPPTSA